MTHLLEIDRLSVHFDSHSGRTQALDQVSFCLEAGQTIGIVGESGCGKSTLGMSLAGLLPSAGVVDGGSIRLDGEEVVGLGARGLRRLRQHKVGVIFQDPMSSLNPVMTIGDQLVEGVRSKEGASRRNARERARQLLLRVGMPDPEERLRSFPHQLSGGMQQRVVIAMAITGSPRLLIADEPTTALDVTVQAQILDLLGALQSELGLSILVISHDLGVVSHLADRVAVMYAGRVIESGPTDSVLSEPAHPYTRGLIATVPASALGRGPTGARLSEIPGTVPSLAVPAVACSFAGRCPRVADECRVSKPMLSSAKHGGDAACFRPHTGERT